MRTSGLRRSTEGLAPCFFLKRSTIASFTFTAPYSVLLISLFCPENDTEMVFSTENRSSQA